MAERGLHKKKHKYTHILEVSGLFVLAFDAPSDEKAEEIVTAYLTILGHGCISKKISKVRKVVKDRSLIDQGVVKTAIVLTNSCGEVIENEM